jgi:2-iminobutanoate/2-iminopropanoate deaminase
MNSYPRVNSIMRAQGAYGRGLGPDGFARSTYSLRMSDLRTIFPADGPAPVGPYSPAVVFQRLVFVSGQGARGAGTDDLAGLDIEAQTEQCLRNVETILRAAGSGLPHVLKVSVFLTDMDEFQRMNGVYQRMFGDHRPARTTIAAAALPAKGLRVEIDCIAYVP